VWAASGSNKLVDNFNVKTSRTYKIQTLNASDTSVKCVAL